MSFQLAKTQKKAERLELVHSDVWGPAPVASYAGNKYFVTFIDDFSRKVWVFAMKEKSEIFGIFKRWRVMIETQTGARLKCLKTDNGGEYCSRDFENYCSENGIRRIKTVPGTPEQNGVAERMNRTILERERSMRFDSGLPTYFWAAAVDTAVYLINRSPSSALDGGISEEVWT